MATIMRRPLASRSLPQPSSHFSPLKTTRALSVKRPRSPDLPEEGDPSYSKRAKAGAVASPLATRDEERERKRAEREAQKEEFKTRYTRAFPSFKFYFDTDNLDSNGSPTQEVLKTKVSQLGARVDDFFSNEITHLITNQPIPADDQSADKENVPKPRSSQSRSAALLRSPIKLRGRGTEEGSVGPGYDLVKKAIAFKIKIWSVVKLESVLDRCLPTTSAPTIIVPRSTASASTANTSTARLTRLLQSERLHGSTERDPTQKRHDFRYFSRASYFVLVEDIHQELATIAAHEYVANKGRDGETKPTWPVLHCHPQARNPFVPFDEREKRRWEKLQQAVTVRENERQRKRARQRRQEEMKRKATVSMHAKKNGDLRRSVSMNNLRRRASHPGAGYHGVVDLDADGCDAPDSANASGFLASGTGGYMAASGNSVGITSTTGTTSTTGGSLRSLQLPAALQGRIQQQVITSRKFPIGVNDKESKQIVGTMGPPTGLPERPAMLRKSRSTNTMRLPKREEGSKPGYCESCRAKFEDFKAHIISRKHRKFATNDANFLQLDYVLARVRRRTVVEVEAETMDRDAKRSRRWSAEAESDNDDTCLPQSSSDQTISQDVWQRPSHTEHDDVDLDL